MKYKMEIEIKTRIRFENLQPWRYNFQATLNEFIDLNKIIEICDIQYYEYEDHDNKSKTGAKIIYKQEYEYRYPKQDSVEERVVNTPIKDLDLSQRTFNCLRNEDIKTVKGIISRRPSELLKCSNFGRKSLREIEKCMNDMGLYVGMYVDGFNQPKQQGE